MVMEKGLIFNQSPYLFTMTGAGFSMNEGLHIRQLPLQLIFYAIAEVMHLIDILVFGYHQV